MSLEKDKLDSSSDLENYYDEINNWDDLDINKDLLRGIYAYGFEKPSPIQKKAIKPIMEKRDLIAQAQSGTGKTGTFSIGALSIIIFMYFFLIYIYLSSIGSFNCKTSSNPFLIDKIFTKSSIL
jgi:hypothetical protein